MPCKREPNTVRNMTLEEVIHLQEENRAERGERKSACCKGSRCKQAAAHNLLNRLSKHQDAALAFLDNFAVSFETAWLGVISAW